MCQNTVFKMHGKKQPFLIKRVNVTYTAVSLVGNAPPPPPHNIHEYLVINLVQSERFVPFTPHFFRFKNFTYLIKLLVARSCFSRYVCISDNDWQGSSAQQLHYQHFHFQR